MMDASPQSMAIIGGGVIGSEYAGIFTALGVEVTLVDSHDRLLPFLDAEIAERLRGHLEQTGSALPVQYRVEKTAANEKQVRITLAPARC